MPRSSDRCEGCGRGTPSAPPPRLTAAYLARRACLPCPAVNKAQAVARVAGKAPVLGESVFVAPNASVLGDVKLGRGSSVWYGAVVRGKLVFLCIE